MNADGGYAGNNNVRDRGVRNCNGERERLCRGGNVAGDVVRSLSHNAPESGGTIPRLAARIRSRDADESDLDKAADEQDYNLVGHYKGGPAQAKRKYPIEETEERAMIFS